MLFGYSPIFFWYRSLMARTKTSFPSPDDSLATQAHATSEEIPAENNSQEEVNSSRRKFVLSSLAGSAAIAINVRRG
ncbi:hypothetical protein, partial [Thiolapillus sp.]